MHENYIAVALAALAVMGSAAIADGGIIYQQDFASTSTDPLNETAPTINNSGSTVAWEAAPTALLNGTFGANTSNWLPFAFGNEIYSLEADVTMPSSGSNNWFALGFNANQAVGNFTTGSHFAYDQTPVSNAHYWILVREKGGWAAFHGPRTSTPTTAWPTGTVDGWPATGETAELSLKIVFDNTDPDARTIAMYINGSQIDLDTSSPVMTRTVATVPVAVGFSKVSTGVVDLHSFTFSAVPEPATASVVGLGAMGLLAGRGRRRA